MSEDQQQPESENEPKATSKTAQATKTRSPSFLKAQSINALRGTIGLLEGIVEKLEAEPVPSIAPVRITEQVLQDSIVTTVTPEVVPDSPTVTPTPVATKPKLLDRILPSFGKVEVFWDKTLAKIRLLLPSTWSEKLSDWMLTGAIALVLVLLLVTTATLLPETEAQVAKAPPNSIEAPPELKAPQAPQLLEVEVPPAPELTPEQSLIAGIQNQVAEITSKYGDGLIKSIEANFGDSRLVVKVGDGWYALKESGQNKLADEVLSRANELDFSKLEIVDLKGTLLARNPVIGPNMVILKRQELAANL
ncbi:MAG: hypothetical protein ABI417_01620 [Coleofasciculaceae cyanobacterium]